MGRDMGTPISRNEAIRLAKQTLAKAEAERMADSQAQYETEGDYIDRRLAVIPKLQQRILDQENEMDRLRADVLSWTKELAKIQAERDEARMLARKFHHGAFANFDKSKYSWLEDNDG